MSLENPPRLFIPGPVQVEPEILAAQTSPMIGHRAPEFAELAGPIHDQLKRLFRTPDRVLVSASSATCLMEGAVRNCVRRRVLCCVNGAFSERWFELCLANGIEADRLDFDLGQAVKPERLAAALARGGYDAVTVVHNETSTGVMSPLEELAKVVRAQDDVLLLVDAVTSLAVVPIETFEWGIDVILTGSQKGLALPPGLAVVAVSDRALDRAKDIPGRGGYVDFVAMAKSHGKDQTPATPAVSLLYALHLRLENIFEDEDAWYEQHLARAELTRAWARERFALYPEPGYESVSLTTVNNTRSISISALNGFLRQRGMVLSNGYGDLKERTFRIGHMGANDLDAHRALLEGIDAFLESAGG